MSQHHRPTSGPVAAGNSVASEPGQAQQNQEDPRARPSLGSLLHLRDDTAMPLYQQLEQQLESLISSGRLPVGTVLPAERQLADELGLSRATVQRAYNTLRQRELVQAQGRRGSVVQAIGPKLHPGMDRLKGFTEEMRLLGKVPSSRILERHVESDRSIASIFGLPSPARFLKLVRIRLGDGVPLSRETAWYNLAAAPALEHADLSGSVYAALKELCGQPLVYAEQAIEAALPTPAECAIFGLAEPVPCLLLKRSSYGPRDVMIEYVEGLFRGDAYSYRLRLGA